jgi:hypothetical protein
MPPCGSPLKSTKRWEEFQHVKEPLVAIVTSLSVMGIVIVNVKRASPGCWRLTGSAGKDRTGEATAIRSMTRKADEARIRQEMAAAIAAYTGPVTKCPPGKARGETGKVKLLIRPRYRAKPPPVTPPRR